MPRSASPHRMANLCIIGSGPTSVLCVGGYVDSRGGWENINCGDILIIGELLSGTTIECLGNNNHPHSPKETGPALEVKPATHAPGMGRLGLYTTTLSNTTVSNIAFYLFIKGARL